MSIFEKLAQERPAPAEAAIRQPRDELASAQLLLDWLQHWNKPIVSLREVHVYGPTSLRGRKDTIDAAETLVRTGWLRPLEAHRHDRRLWEIVRKPVVGPRVEPTERRLSDRL